MYPQPGQQQVQSPHQQQGSWDGGNQHLDLQYRHAPNGHQQPPPPNSSYGPPPGQQQQQQGGSPGQQPSNLRADRPEMATIQPHYTQHPDMYRLPAPSHFYPPPAPQQQDYRPSQPQVSSVAQSAPRQRTAIACKYCRRRKIRCSGFESSDDGRCTNCVRFSQDCVFTPVSAQTQAFVPAQAVYGPNARTRAGQGQLQLYGSYGQPLPRQSDPYGPPPQHNYGMPPGGPYSAPPYVQPYPPQAYDPQPLPANRRRGRDEPHTPTLPPPNPGPTAHLAHREAELHSQPQQSQAPPSSYTYPDPTAYTNGAASPASSTHSFQSHPQPYYAPQPPRRASPTAVYPFEQKFEQSSRSSTSPQAQGHPYSYGGPGMQPPVPQPQAVSVDGRTSTPQSAGPENGTGKNAGFKIQDIVSEGKSGNGNGVNGKPERRKEDNDMVSALNRTSRR